MTGFAAPSPYGLDPNAVRKEQILEELKTSRLSQRITQDVSQRISNDMDRQHQQRRDQDSQRRDQELALELERINEERLRAMTYYSQFHR